MKRPLVAELIVVFGLMLIGGLIRVYTAMRAPGFFYDEAIYAIDSLRVLREPGIPIFFDTLGHMREPLYMYIQAIALAFQQETTAFGFRLTSALIGTLTIPIVWLVGREWKGPALGLLAAAVFTFMRWHVHFSGLGFRTILSPMFLALVLLFLLRYFRTQHWRDAVLCGFFIGAGLYSYLAFRLVPIAVGASFLTLFWMLRQQPAQFRKAAVGFAALVAVALAVFTPLGINFLRNPEHFTGRAEETNFLNQEGAFARLSKQVIDVALSPMLRGDHVEKHNIPGPPRFIQIPDRDAVQTITAWSEENRRAREEGREPMDPHGTGTPTFPLPLALFFYGGLLVTALGARDPRNASLLILLAVGSLASILSFGAPNLLRLLMLSPVAALLIAEGFLCFFNWLDGRLQPFGKASLPIQCFLLGGIVVWSLAVDAQRWYYWPNHLMVPGGFNTELAQIGSFLGSQPDRLPVRLPFGEHPTLTYLADGTRFNPTDEELGDRWWELRTVPPFPLLEVRGTPVPGGRSIEIEHPAGIPFGLLVEIQSN